MVGIASAATAVVIGYVAAGTRTIRVGAGGIMLPNHAPLVVAEQFGTLESLYPGGSTLASVAPRELISARCGRCGASRVPTAFLKMCWSCRRSSHRCSKVKPCRQCRAPVSRCRSGFSDRVCSAHSSPRCSGLPYAFASHFAPSALMPALQAYRSGFKRSQQLDRPYVAAGVNVFVADTDARARRLFTSAQQQFTNLLRGAPGRLQPPLDDIEAYWTPAEKAQASAMLTCSFVGSAETVRHGLSEFIEQTGVDELIVASAIYDHAARLRFYEILADLLAAKVQSEKQGIRATFRMPSRSLRPPYGSRTTNKAPPSGGSGPRPYPRKSRGRNDAGRIWQLRLPFLSRRA